jgi:hypothetical protein
LKNTALDTNLPSLFTDANSGQSKNLNDHLGYLFYFRSNHLSFNVNEKKLAYIFYSASLVVSPNIGKLGCSIDSLFATRYFEYLKTISFLKPMFSVTVSYIVISKLFNIREATGLEITWVEIKSDKDRNFLSTNFSGITFLHLY